MIKILYKPLILSIKPRNFNVLFPKQSVVIVYNVSSVEGTDRTLAKVELLFHTEISEEDKISFAESLIQIIKEKAPRRTFPGNTVGLVLGPLYAYLDSLQPELTNPEVNVVSQSTTQASSGR